MLICIGLYWQLIAVSMCVLADNPYALKEVDRAEDFDVNRSAARCFYYRAA